MNFDLIDDETLDAIPDDDPRFAFAQFERACRKSLLEAEKNEEDWAAVASLRQDYMHDVVAAAQHYGISELADYRIPLGEDYKQDRFDDFVRRRFCVTHFRLTSKTRRSHYSVEVRHPTRIDTDFLHHLKPQ